MHHPETQFPQRNIYPVYTGADIISHKKYVPWFCSLFDLPRFVTGSVTHNNRDKKKGKKKNQNN